MQSTNLKQNTEKQTMFNKFLNGVEKVGNKLPHPVTIFLIFCVMIIIISHIVAASGLSIEFEMIDKKTLETKLTTVRAVSLMTPEGIRYMFTSAVNNFTSFAPLGTVLVAMLGVGVAEGTGLIQAVLRKMVLSTPKKLITSVVVLAGVMSNIASDAGYVVLVPLGALVFMSFNRHPIAGIAAAFAGVSGGFSANLLIGTLDPLLGGISTEAARILDPTYTVTATANYYFMFVSTFLITIAGTYVTEKIVEPRLGTYGKSEIATDSISLSTISPEEKRGLKFALIGFILFIAGIVALVAPYNGILRDAEHRIIGHTPFMDGIVLIILLFFFVPGVAYGIGAGSIKSDKQIVSAMSKAMSSMGGYIVLAFVAAQFVSYFAHTNLGIILAVKGANFLKATGMTGLPLIVLFIIVAGFINLFMGSASAKWAIMAPVFIPMLMKLGYSPEFTQVAYRIGDSSTNIISPLMSYFAVIVAFAEKYQKNMGIGTLISIMLPYSLIFLVGWTILLIIWFTIGAPIGPDSFIHLVSCILMKF